MATIRVSWTPNPPEEQVYNYTLEKRFNGGGWSVVVNTPNTTADVPASNPGTYEFRVTPLNVAGPGPVSDVASTGPVPSKGATPTLVVLP